MGGCKGERLNFGGWTTSLLWATDCGQLLLITTSFGFLHFHAGRETLISRVGETQLWWIDNHLFCGQLLIIATLNMEYLHFRGSVLLQEYSCKCNTDNTQATQTKQSFLVNDNPLWGTSSDQNFAGNFTL